MRPTWDTYFLGIAQAVAARADCSRRQVGAVVVKANRIVATGYNGAPSGDPGCLSGACPRGRHYPHAPLTDDGRMICGGCRKLWPCPEAVEPGSSYDNCTAVHAESNALLYADRDRCEGATMYITCAPCHWCDKLIKGAGIARLVWANDRGLLTTIEYRR